MTIRPGRVFRFLTRSKSEVIEDIREEFAFHVDMRIAELLRTGMSEADAIAQARREFGDARRGAGVCAGHGLRLERRRRIARSGMELKQDLRYAFRLVARNRAFSLVAILTLGVAIGGNTAIFSFVNGLILKPLPVTAPDRLVRIYPGESTISWSNARDLHARTDVFTDVTLQRSIAVNLEIATLPVRVIGSAVARNYFSVLGIGPLVGRTLLPSDGRSDLIVLSHRVWTTRFGSDPSIVGRAVRLDGRVHEVIGVMPPSFRGIAPPGLMRDFWIPLDGPPGAGVTSDSRNSRFEAFDRLRPGVTSAQAAVSLRVAARQIATEYPDTPTAFTAITVRRIDGLDALRGVSGALLPVLAFVALLGVAAVCVLLVACANLAGLLVGRATARSREIAIRVALGAGRGRLVRQLLTESLILALFGGAAGVLLGAWTVQGVNGAIAQLPFPVELDLSLDVRVLTFALALSAVTAVVFGVAPARRAARVELMSALKEEGTGIGGRQRFRRLLVVGEVAACTLLLVWSGLFVRSLWQINSVDPGFDASGVLLANLSSSEARLAAPARTMDELMELQERVRQMPGVESAGMSWAVPLTLMSREGFNVFQEGVPRGSRGTMVDANRLTPGWFATVRIPIVAGRDFTWRDREDAPRVILVNETLARRVFQGSAIGQRLKFYGPGDVLVTAEVVGIVRDSKYWTLGETVKPTVYLAARQQPAADLTLHVRTSNTAAVANAIRHQVEQLDTGMSVELKPMLDAIAVATMPARMGAMLTSAFGVLAALLAMLGVYGLVSFVVADRTREIGIRRAIGATATSIVVLVMKGSGVVAALGLFLGLAAGSLSAPLLRGLTVNVSPRDPVVLFGSAGLVIGATLVATVIPALRSTRVDPLQALREQ